MAGIIFLQGLQLRALLECGYYSREGLIWGNTVHITVRPYNYAIPISANLVSKVIFNCALKYSLNDIFWHFDSLVHHITLKNSVLVRVKMAKIAHIECVKMLKIAVIEY